MKRTQIALTKRPTPASMLERLEQACATFNLARMDQELKDEGLTSRTFILGAKESAGLNAASGERPYRFPSTRELLKNDPSAIARFFYLAAMDSAFLSRAFRDKETDPGCSMAGLFGPSPKDWRDSHLRRLLDRGHFQTGEDAPLENARENERSRRKQPETEAYDPKLALVAYLISRGLNREDLVETYAPALRYEDFHAIQSKINRVLDRTTPELARRFEKFWNDPKLKPDPKKALLAVYMDNEECLSQRAVAKKLGIPFETLRARMRSGLRVLRQHFPELTPVNERQPGYLKNLYKTDLRMNGFLRNSSCKHIPPRIRLWNVDQGWVPTTVRQEKYKDLKKTPQKDFVKNLRFYDRTHYEPWFSETSLSIWGKNLTKENEPADKVRVPGKKRAPFDPLIEGSGPGLRVDLGVMPLESWLSATGMTAD